MAISFSLLSILEIPLGPIASRAAGGGGNEEANKADVSLRNRIDNRFLYRSYPTSNHRLDRLMRFELVLSARSTLEHPILRSSDRPATKLESSTIKRRDGRKYIRRIFKPDVVNRFGET